MEVIKIVKLEFIFNRKIEKFNPVAELSVANG